MMMTATKPRLTAHAKALQAARKSPGLTLQQVQAYTKCDVASIEDGSHQPSLTEYIDTMNVLAWASALSLSEDNDVAA